MNARFVFILGVLYGVLYYRQVVSLYCRFAYIIALLNTREERWVRGLPGREIKSFLFSLWDSQEVKFFTR